MASSIPSATVYRIEQIECLSLAVPLTTMAIPLLLALVLVGWAFYNAYCLLVNYRRASQLNVPTVCILVSPDSPRWVALQTAYSFIFKHVPFDTFSFTRYCRLGWEFHDRSKTHQRIGDVWMLVTPDRNWLYVAEAEAAYDIFSRGRDFGRPVWMLGMLPYPANK